MPSLISLIISIVLIAASLNGKPQSFSVSRALISPPPNLEYFSFGFQMSIADSLWIRAIQDFDYCESMLKVNLCKGNGWLSNMMDTLTNLAPDYLVAYRNGGLALTVLVSDYPGASKIFDKGVRVFPDDQRLLYRAGYHALIEEKNEHKAANLFLRAAKNGGQPWLYSLASRLYVADGKKELAKSLYEELSQEGIDEGILKRMKEKIDAAK